jgi:hypothetical protein
MRKSQDYYQHEEAEDTMTNDVPKMGFAGKTQGNFYHA